MYDKNLCVELATNAKKPIYYEDLTILHNILLSLKAQTYVFRHITSLLSYKCFYSIFSNQCAVADRCGCPNGWVYFEGSCYHLDHELQVDWTEADVGY